MSRNTKIVLFAFAGILLVVAFAWSYFTRHMGETSLLADMLSERGYSISPSALYVADHESDTSIALMFPDEDLQSIIDASKESGFPSDVDKRGDIVVMLAAIDEESVITLFIIDGQVEFGFIQQTDGNTVLPLAVKVR